MKNKTIDIVLVLLILVLSLSYFAIKGIVLKNNPFIEKVNAIESLVAEEKWDEAEILGKTMKKTWIKLKPLLMINFAEAEFSYLEQSINTIIGGTKSKDPSTVYSHIKIIRDLWTNFNKLVPEP